jgi:amino-acid N-acetyltransferase
VTTIATTQIRQLDANDEALDAARTLLASNALPTEDLVDPAVTLFGAFRERSLVGVIGLQTCDGVGLLRSLAVDPARRGQGLAGALCDHLFAVVRARQLSALYLLTTDASDYFARHGFVEVDRAEVPAVVRATAQFSSLCPASAHVMRR